MPTHTPRIALTTGSSAGSDNTRQGIENLQRGAGDMTQWGKNASLISGTHVVERENQFL